MVKLKVRVVRAAVFLAPWYKKYLWQDSQLSFGAIRLLSC